MYNAGKAQAERLTMNAPLQAHRIETTLTQSGTLTLDNLPFQAGETVEVLVMPSPSLPAPQDRYPLRGSPVQYQDPTEPVAQQDWESPL